MGVIQNSMNQMLATVMGGAIGLKHIQGQQATIKSNELEEIANLSKELPQLAYKDVPVAEKNLAHQEKRVKNLDEKYKDINLNARQARALTMANRALTMAQGELDNKQMLLKLKTGRFNELREKYGDTYTESVGKTKNRKGVLK